MFRPMSEATRSDRRWLVLQVVAIVTIALPGLTWMLASNRSTGSTAIATTTRAMQASASDTAAIPSVNGIEPADTEVVPDSNEVILDLGEFAMDRAQPGNRDEYSSFLAQFGPGNGANGFGPAGQNGNGGRGNNSGFGPPGGNQGRNQGGNQGGNGQGGVFINPTVRFADESTDRLTKSHLNATRSVPTEGNLFSD